MINFLFILPCKFFSNQNMNWAVVFLLLLRNLSDYIVELLTWNSAMVTLVTWTWFDGSDAECCESKDLAVCCVQEFMSSACIEHLDFLDLSADVERQFRTFQEKDKGKHYRSLTEIPKLVKMEMEEAWSKDNTVIRSTSLHVFFSSFHLLRVAQKQIVVNSITLNTLQNWQFCK